MGGECSDLHSSVSGSLLIPVTMTDTQNSLLIYVVIRDDDTLMLFFMRPVAAQVCFVQM